MYCLPIAITTFFLGFNSGISYATLGATFTVFLNDFNVDYTVLGFLSLILLPYSFKALWSPIVDMTPLKIFGNISGLRKSWLFLTQICLVICYLILAIFADPNKYLTLIIVVSVIAAIIAATYDNALHGYRIDIFSISKQSKNNALTVLSFKVGFITSLSSGLLLSSFLEWKMIFCIFAVMLIPGIIVILFSVEHNKDLVDYSFKVVLKNLRKNYFIPFISLIKQPYAISVIVIVMFFKASDAFMTTLLIPYLLEMGFTKAQVMGSGKLIEFITSSSGVIIGGYALHRGYNILKVMICVELLAALSNLAFISFSYNNSTFLLVGISFFEGVISSMSNVVIMTFMTTFCKTTTKFTATSYAILESLSLLNRLIISSFGGSVVKNMGWNTFLITSSLLSIPTLFLCYYLLNKARSQTMFFGLKDT